MTPASHLSRHPSHALVDGRQQRYLADAREARVRRGVRPTPTPAERGTPVSQNRAQPQLRLVAPLEPRPTS